MAKMERDLLKKLDELERRDAFRKYDRFGNTEPFEIVTRNMDIRWNRAVASCTYPEMPIVAGFLGKSLAESGKTIKLERSLRKSTQKVRIRVTVESGMIWNGIMISVSVISGC